MNDEPKLHCLRHIKSTIINSVMRTGYKTTYKGL